MYAVLPALKGPNQILVHPEASLIVCVFPFQHLPMADSLSVSWAPPTTGKCTGVVSGMLATVSCFGLTDVEHTITIGIILIVNGELLPANFSQSFTPMYTDSVLPSSTPGWQPKYMQTLYFGV